jgi:N-acetylglucosaminyldiphosphoundecaprenol N-acetyl-beta-D-mannosaminyltransferase
MREEILESKGQELDFVDESSSLSDSLWRECWCIGGLPVDNVSTEEVLSLLEHAHLLEQKTVINTPNLNFLRRVRSEPLFYRALLDSDMLIPDGMPVLWLAKLLGAPMKERVAGSSVVTSLIHRVGSNPISLFFFGGDPGVAKRAHRVCNSVSSPVTSAGFYNPGWGSVEQLSASENLEIISENEPDILLVSLPAAKSVPWIHACKDKVKARVFIASGITVSFIAGAVKRAPVYIQKLGLEWVWRIKEEPRLARRYFVDAMWLLKELLFTYLPLKIFHTLNTTPQHGDSESFVVERQSGGLVSISLPAFCDAVNVEAFLHTCEELLEEPLDIELDLRRTNSLDSRFLGSLLVLRKIQRDRGSKLSLVNLSPKLRLLMRLHNVAAAFSQESSSVVS